MVVIICLLIVFAGVCIVDTVLAALCYRKGNKKGRLLGHTCVLSLFVTVSYILAIIVKDYRAYSILSSLYFAGIDVLLLVFLEFIRCFTSDDEQLRHDLWWKLLVSYGAFDIAVLTINPYCEIALRYLPREGTIVSHYSYQMMPLYQLHLGFCYLLVCVVLAFLIRKVHHVPKTYRAQYRAGVWSIVAVVVINAVYLYYQGPEGYDYLDYSLLGYSIAAMLMYWTTFEYSTHGMARQFQSWIVERLEQGIVLFDYNDTMLMFNAKAEKLLPEGSLANGRAIADFMKDCDIHPGAERDGEHYTFQCYIRRDHRAANLRCDYSALYSERHELMGRLFVFSDQSTDSDIITGFPLLRHFAADEQALCGNRVGSCVATVFDINGLTAINKSQGRDEGDRVIQRLAGVMRAQFPHAACYVRCTEATLASVCFGLSEEVCFHSAALVAEEMAKSGIGIQYAVSASDGKTTAAGLVERAVQVMRTKKLLDKSSSHSEVLNSLIQALQECDKDTEAHVKRTQQLGAELGRRIGLSDEEQSNLALLAVLHDIGKIGIPLDILNKPGRLTESEWEVLKTHTEKGYQIASSSNELKDIADMILYHHERWDGKGYPDGLSKESIPLLSRMIAVVDAYDAMVNNRAYRRALPESMARQELRRCAGTQFDPSIVNAFLQMLRDEEAKRGIQIDETVETSVPGAAPEMALQWSVNGASKLDQLRVHVVDYSVYATTAEGRIVQVDDNFQNLTGYTWADVQERKLTQKDLIFEEDWDYYIQQVIEEIGVKATAFFEHRIRCKDGSGRYVYCLGRQYYDSAAREERTEMTITDCTGSYAVQTIIGDEHRRALKRLESWENKYRRDPLTGLLNTEAFKHDVEMKMLADNCNAMMLMMDVDHFKEYNDTYGHRAGDERLIMVAQALAGALRDDDLACRMGGDEFAAVLFFNQDVPEDVLIQRAQQVCDKINMTLTNGPQKTTISLGGAFMKDENLSFDRLYEAADKALYRAKHDGRARFSM